jgi:hypothetical protein
MRNFELPKLTGKEIDAYKRTKLDSSAFSNY